jgi:hypothetical protein
MYRPDQYLAVVVGIMFVVGILLAAFRARQRSRNKQRHGTGMARRHHAGQ